LFYSVKKRGRIYFEIWARDLPTNGHSCTITTTELKLTKGKVNSIPFNQSRWAFEK
jgi:hypothetical protein